MITLFYTYFMNSLNVTFIILLLVLLEPLLKKRFSANCLYRVWLILLLGLLIPLRFELTNSLFSIRLPQISGENIESNYPDTINNFEFSELIGTDALKSSRNQIPTNYNTTIIRDDSIYPEFQRQLPIFFFLRQNFYSLVCVFWVIGIFFILLRNTIRYNNYLHQLKRFISPITEDYILIQLQQCQNEVNHYYGRRHKAKIPTIYNCSIITSPMTIGTFRPVILIPKESYTEKDLHFLLMHELIHIYRQDFFLKCIKMLVLAMNWFNPVCYLLSWHIDHWCEVSCDQVVLHKSSRTDCMDYSRLLLRCATPLSKHKIALITNFYGGTKTMKNRILSIMNHEKKHPGKLLLVLVAVIVATTVFISVGKHPVTAAESGILNATRSAYAAANSNIVTTIMKDSSNKKIATKVSSERLDTKDLREEVADYASKKVDVPYTWGGNEFSSGVDCSGFIQAVYKEFDYDLPRTSREQLKVCEEVSLDNLLPGDLIFYTNSNDNKVNHVAIYLGKDKVIHAKNKIVGVTIENFDYRKPYTAGRVIMDH